MEEKIKVFDRNKLSGELNKIRVTMDLDPRKAKQMLTNLIHNINDKKGVSFKLIDPDNYFGE
jgi:hypothetical protein